jgi:hypothetical protein
MTNIFNELEYPFERCALKMAAMAFMLKINIVKYITLKA